MLEDVPNHLNTQDMCVKAVDKYPWLLEYAPEQLKTHEMCGKALAKESSVLKVILDWFITPKMCQLGGAHIDQFKQRKKI